MFGRAGNAFPNFEFRIPNLEIPISHLLSAARSALVSREDGKARRGLLDEDDDEGNSDLRRVVEDFRFKIIS